MAGAALADLVALAVALHQTEIFVTAVGGFDRAQLSIVGLLYAPALDGIAGLKRPDCPCLAIRILVNMMVSDAVYASHRLP